MLSWGSDPALGRSGKACALLLVNGRWSRERGVSLEDKGPAVVLGGQRHLVELMAGVFKVAG